MVASVHSKDVLFNTKICIRPMFHVNMEKHASGRIAGSNIHFIAVLELDVAKRILVNFDIQPEATMEIRDTGLVDVAIITIWTIIVQFIMKKLVGPESDTCRVVLSNAI